MYIFTALWLCSRAVAQTYVTFPDPNLESAVLSALGRTNGPLTTTDLLGLTNLSHGWRVTNLSGLEYATNLESLRLDYSNPNTLSNLTALPRLRTLALETEVAANLDGLSSLVTLTNLDLYASALTNFNLLTGLTNLTTLDLSFSRITDPAPLAALPRLQVLDLSGNQFGNCAKLALLTNVSGTLYLDTTALTNIDGLAGLANLTQLTLWRNTVQDMAALSNLTALTSLDLGYVPVRDFAVLTGLTNLQRLYVEGTSLTNLNRLPALPLLTTLDANYNRLDDLSAVTRWPALQWLNVSYNHLTNILALGTMTNLGTVYLTVNLLNISGTTLLVIDGLTSKGAHVYYDPQHRGPFIDVPGPCLVPANETSSLAFSTTDDLTAGGQLLLEVHCSNPALVNVVTSSTPVLGFAGPASSAIAFTTFVPNGPSIPGRSGYLNLTPATNQTGTATITMTVTDETGFSTQTNFDITIVQPAPFDGLTIGCVNSNLTWRTFGTSPWQAETNVVYMRTNAAANGTLDSWLEADVTGPGLFEFWWRCAGTNRGYGAELTAICPDSGLSGHASLATPGFTIPPLLDWQRERLSLPAGRWRLRWQALQQYFFAGPVSVWVADVSFTSEPAPCWLEPSPYGYNNGMFMFNLHGAPGETYDVEASPDLHSWARLRRTTLPDFQALFTDSAAAPGSRFYRLHNATLAPMWLETPAVDTKQNILLTVHSDPQQPLTIEWSTDLLNWATLVQTNNANGTLQLGDNSSAISDRKFYRAKALPYNYPAGVPGSPFNLARRHQPQPVQPLPQ